MKISKDKPKMFDRDDLEFLFETRERPNYFIYFIVKKGFYKGMVGRVAKRSYKNDTFYPRPQNFYKNDFQNMLKNMFWKYGAVLESDYLGSGEDLYFKFIKGSLKGFRGSITYESFKRSNVTIGWNSLVPEEKKRWFKEVAAKESVEIKRYSNHRGGLFLFSKDGVEWETTFSTFLSRKNTFLWYKGSSVGEHLIELSLLEAEVPFVREKTIYHEDGTRQRMDFYIDSLNLCIEYNGEQHYLESDFFEINLDKQRKFDKMKKEYCQKNNINLLVIPFWKRDKIKRIIKEVVLDNGATTLN